MAQSTRPRVISRVMVIYSGGTVGFVWSDELAGIYLASRRLSRPVYSE